MTWISCLTISACCSLIATQRTNLAAIGLAQVLLGQLPDQLDHPRDRSGGQLGLMRVVDAARNVAMGVDRGGGLQPAGDKGHRVSSRLGTSGEAGIAGSFAWASAVPKCCGPGAACQSESRHSDPAVASARIPEPLRAARNRGTARSAAAVPVSTEISTRVHVVFSPVTDYAPKIGFRTAGPAADRPTATRTRIAERQTPGATTTR